MKHIKLFEAFSRSEWIEVFDIFKSFTDEFDAFNVNPDYRQELWTQVIEYLKGCPNGIYYVHTVPNEGSHYFSIYFVGQTWERRKEAEAFLQTNVIDRVKSIGHKTALMNDAPVQSKYGSSQWVRERGISCIDMYINVSVNPNSQSNISESIQDTSELMVQNLIKKNIPEEIYHIKELATDLKDEYTGTRIDFSFVYNYDIRVPVFIPLDQNLNPDVSKLLWLKGDMPISWIKIHQMIKSYIDNVDQIAFCIDFVSNGMRSEIKKNLKNQILDYDRIVKKIRIFDTMDWLIVQIAKK